MKRLLFIAALLIASSSRAVDLSLQEFRTSNDLTVANTTVSLSSTSATTITPAGRYMELQLSAPAATYYYRIDGVTTSVTSSGFPVLNTVATVIKVLNGETVALQSGAGATAETLRAVKITAK